MKTSCRKPARLYIYIYSYRMKANLHLEVDRTFTHILRFSAERILRMKKDNSTFWRKHNHKKERTISVPSQFEGLSTVNGRFTTPYFVFLSTPKTSF